MSRLCILTFTLYPAADVQSLIMKEIAKYSITIFFDRRSLYLTKVQCHYSSNNAFVLLFLL